MLLSGGIDSSLVLALIRKVYPKLEIFTFTLGCSPSDPDMIFSRIVQDLFKTIHYPYIPSKKEYHELLVEFNKVKKYDFKGDENVYIICKYAKEFSNIIITGDGGDACFGGHWLHRYPLGHKEKGKIKSFDEINPNMKKVLEKMIEMGFREFKFKEKSQIEDFNAVWDYFQEDLKLTTITPLMHTAEVLGLEVYTPFTSTELINFMRDLPYQNRIERKLENKLASRYLDELVIERKKVGFPDALKSLVSH